ncbi:MAG: DUF839 domain-containing protein [Xanthomonadales bacterium]|nr:DUF839 domain-containing protein [Xanthomonadales bacterium]
MGTTDRRGFLKHGLVAAGGLGLGVLAWSRFTRSGDTPGFHHQLGPLYPVNDLTTGLPILKLPKGFRYHSFAWAGETLADGYLSPMSCDGMGVVADNDGIVTLIRNHELSGSFPVIGDPASSWDTSGGGTTTLRFDTKSARLVDSRISLSGTLENCSGGVTPWGTWLSCEEAPVTPDMLRYGTELRQKFWHMKDLQRAHGYVFEVHPDGEQNPQPIVPMGQFYHEAAAVDPHSGAVYMTEDRSPYAGLYRYLPDVPGELAAGGRLQMLRVEGFKELIRSVPLNKTMACDWVNIAEPGQGHTPGTHDCSGVVNQGLAGGATGFLSLEGCTFHDQAVYFTSKSGGDQKAGQIYRLNDSLGSLELIFESSGHNGFSGPDNLVVSPRGSLMICEDRLGVIKRGQRIAGLGSDGELFEFCQANPELQANYAGFNLAKTAIRSEWSGVCFSGDGEWMFANLQVPGISFAITGPWQDGPV